MFFEDLKEIPKIAQRNGCTVIVSPNEAKIEIKKAFLLAPEQKTTITIDQVREVLGSLMTKQTSDQYILIRPADKLGEEAENVILKSLEEPQENVHFVLVTEKPSMLLPTILSRASVYVWRGGVSLVSEIKADEKTKAAAKKLISAKQTDLMTIAEEMTKKKDGVRAQVLNILEVAIEMGYKTYFATGKEVFLHKTEKFITAHENISQNGHVKLHLVADLI